VDFYRFLKYLLSVVAVCFYVVDLLYEPYAAVLVLLIDLGFPAKNGLKRQHQDATFKK